LRAITSTRRESPRSCAWSAAANLIAASTNCDHVVPTGLRAWIEDVITDEAARGQGVGELLTRAMLDRARQLGCTTVDLTSRPSREAANRLYRRVGFRQRDTNVYRFELRG
jgi:ribosomal protein S18 acetylase RimI-like enzyme